MPSPHWSRLSYAAGALACSLYAATLQAQHRDPVYVDSLASDWQPGYWDCAGTLMAQCSSLDQQAVVHSGTAAIEVDHCCPGGWGALGADRRAPDWTELHYMYPNQYQLIDLYFNPGDSLSGIDSVQVTLDTGTSSPITSFIDEPVTANTWHHVAVPISTLNPGGAPFFRVYFRNTSSQQPVYYLDDITLLWVDDTTPPELGNVTISDVTDSDARISWTTDEHTRSTLAYWVDGPPTAVDEAGYSLTHSVLLTGLLPDTAYTFRITARDHQEDPAAPSNESSYDGSFRTAPPDRVPPVIAGVMVDSVTSSRATVCWDTDEPSTSRVDFGISDYASSVSDATMVTRHCATVSGLAARSTYRYRVLSVDRSGNAAAHEESPPLTFTTLIPISATLSVDAAVPLRPFPDGIRGAALGNWSYYWSRPYPGHSQKLVELTKLIRPGVLRHAGGLASNQVEWDRTNRQCYPGQFVAGAWCDRRPYSPWRSGTDTCSAPARPVPNAYHYAYQADEIDALAELASAVGAEVMIEVDVTTCDPTMWADMLHYTNVERGHGFRYWELGNELDLELMSGATDVPVGADYVERYKLYYQALKSVDPTISIVGPSTAAHEEDGYFNPMSRYIDPLTLDQEVADNQMLDVLSYHHYPMWNRSGRLTTHEDMFSLTFPEPNRSRQHIDDCAAGKRALLDARGHSNAAIAVTEFNAIAATQPTSLAFNHAQALYMADTLPRQAAAGADIVIHWELYDQPYDYSSGSVTASYGLINHNGSTANRNPTTGAIAVDDRFTVTPTYYAYFMLAQLFGDQLVATQSDRPESLSIWASTDSGDPNTLELMVVNLDAESVEASVDLRGFAPRAARAYTMANASFSTAADPRTVIDGTSINGLVIDTGTPQSIATSAAAILAAGTPVSLDGQQLQLSLPGYSATSVVLSSEVGIFSDGFESGGVARWSLARP